MSKKVSIAAILAGVAGIASAQTNVTVYGILDTGLAVSNGGPNGQQVSVANGVSTNSRLGFKGTEKLNNDLSVNFVLEAAIAVDTGGTDKDNLLFGRESWVGLQSKKLGMIAIGRQYTPIYKTLTALDPFANNFGGAAGRLMKAETGGTRASNTVTYSSPVMGGFDTKLFYAAGEQPGDTAKARQLAASVGYESGRLALRVAHHQTNNATATDSSGTTLYMAKYDFGVAIGSIGYGVSHGMKTTDERDLLLGVTVPLGPHKFMANYIRKNDRATSTDFDANQVAMAYAYSLSKRTALYAAYARLDNIRFTTTKFGTGPREFDMGIRHSF
ncbi:porin [Massilia horti]|uniref:Porin n=1 Tax=Massilia horti TaxID=2562153 RepID=A0A4Y9TAL7_9BURK|nr:porin [Massilia horti]TFW35644.1 porin [Massilia horti]